MSEQIPPAALSGHVQSPYAFVAMVPQNVTESLLVHELRRKGGDVKYDTKFVSAEQQDEGVIVTVDHKGELRKLTASFVVGCDGAHSQVRAAVTLPLEGGITMPLLCWLTSKQIMRFPRTNCSYAPVNSGRSPFFP